MSSSESVAMGTPPSRGPAPGCETSIVVAGRRGPIRWSATLRAGDKADGPPGRSQAGPKATLPWPQGPRTLGGGTGQAVRSRFVGSFDCLSFLTDYGLDDGFVAAC